MPADPTEPDASPSDPRPAIAILCNSHTPYRLHLHRRIANELPDVRLFTLYTHQTSNSNWQLDAPPEIGPVLFGKGESSANQDRVRHQWREWQRGGQIIAWLAKNRARFVLVMGYNDAGRLRVMRWCHRHRVPCYLFGDSNIHGDRVSGIKAFLKQRFLRHILRWCNGVFVCGSLGRRYFNRYGVAPEKAFPFPYEPNYDLIRNLSPDTVTSVAGQFGLAVGRRRLVYSGRLAAEKRVDLLIDAFAAIASDRPEWDLLLIGDGPLRASLRARIPTHLMSRVVWTGFLDDQMRVAALYRSSDVLVLPSDYEPWALVINEAVAAGLAVVSTNVVGAAAELVLDGVNGRLFPPGDLVGLVDCLQSVTTPDTLEQMKAAAAGVLEKWRNVGDPVAGLRSALRIAKVL